MFCEKCGRQLENGSMFCDSCGARIVQPIGGQPDVGIGDQPDISRGSQPDIGMGNSAVGGQPLGLKKLLAGKLPLVVGLCTAAVVVTVSAVALVAKDGFNGESVAEVISGVVKDLGSSSKADKKAGSVKVTKKLEKQYQKCLEAYQSYYDQECKDSGYDMSVAFTLDKDGLPLLWLEYWKISDDLYYPGPAVTQVLKFVNGKVKVLAEARNVKLHPFLSDESIAACDNSNKYEGGGLVFYIYDEKSHMFKKITGFEEDVYGADNLYYFYYYVINDSTQTAAYVGKSLIDFSSLIRTALVGLGEFGSSINFYYPDGEVVDLREEESLKKSQEELKSRIEGFTNANPDTSLEGDLGYANFVSGFDADARFRLLQNNPVYTSKDLFVLFRAHFGYKTTYTVVDDIDLRKY